MNLSPQAPFKWFSLHRAFGVQKRSSDIKSSKWLKCSLSHPLKVVAGVVCSFTHRVGWTNGLSTEFVLVVILYLDCKINSTQCLNSSIFAICKNFQLVSLAAFPSFVCLHVCEVSFHVFFRLRQMLWAASKSHSLSPREKLSESWLLDPLTVSLGLIQIINASGAE